MGCGVSEPSAERHAVGRQTEHRGDPGAVGDAAAGDDRDVTRLNHRAHHGQRADIHSGGMAAASVRPQIGPHRARGSGLAGMLAGGSAGQVTP